MQYQPHATGSVAPQLSLFEGLIAHRATPFASIPHTAPQPAADHLSEMSLSGSNGHCRLLLAPILRDLSEAADTRWLTLIAPPASLSHRWLREASLNRDRILLLPAQQNREALDLACKALMSGCSHTVITFERLDRASRLRLRAAAELGQTQSLNIRLGN